MAVNVLISDRSVTIPSLVAGFSYTAVVGASNVEGTTSIDCPVFVLYVGKVSSAGIVVLMKR